VRQRLTPLVLPAIAFVLIVMPLAALSAIGWLDWRPGLAPPAATSPKRADPADQADPVKPADPADQARTIAIKSPGNKAVDGRKIGVELALDGKLAPKPGVRLDPTRGLVHVHLVLDDGRFDEPGHSSSSLFDVEGATGYSGVAGGDTGLTYRDVPPGTYTLRAELVVADHSSPVSGDEVEFTVK